MGRMMEMLNAAGIFYMGGVQGRDRPRCIDAATEHVQQLITMLGEVRLPTFVFVVAASLQLLTAWRFCHATIQP